MLYRSVSRKHFAWLYKHVGAFKKNILLCLLLSVLTVASSLLFVQVTKIFMEAVERGEDFSFVMLVVSLTTLKGANIFCEEFKSYCSTAEFHSADSLSRLTTDVFSVSSCLIGTVPELIYALVRLSATCVYLAAIDPSLTLAVVLIMSVNVIFGRSYAKKLLPISKEVQSLDSKVWQFMQEHLQHQELIVTLEKTAFIWNRLKSLQRKVYEKISAVTKLNISAMSLIDAALNVSYIVILLPQRKNPAPRRERG